MTHELRGVQPPTADHMSVFAGSAARAVDFKSLRGYNVNSPIARHSKPHRVRGILTYASPRFAHGHQISCFRQERLVGLGSII